MRATTTHQGSGRSHGVEREPDSVLIRFKRLMPNPKHAPTPTTHKQCSEHMQAQENNQHTQPHRPDTLIVPHKTGLPRKEVIQPHLPVRLPCYDFAPITSPTFDRSSLTRLGHGLRVLPTLVA